MDTAHRYSTHPRRLHVLRGHRGGARGTLAKVGVGGIMGDALLEKAEVAQRAITTRLIDTGSTPMLLKRSHAMSNGSNIRTQQCR